jgi:putative FmdB family regulatory protein
MPLYEYYCPPCGSQFEVLRPVSKMDDPAVCPSGHTTNNRVLSVFAPVMKSTQGNVATAVMPQAGDSCCSTGGGCSCC